VFPRGLPKNPHYRVNFRSSRRGAGHASDEARSGFGSQGQGRGDYGKMEAVTDVCRFLGFLRQGGNGPNGVASEGSSRPPADEISMVLLCEQIFVT